MLTKTVRHLTDDIDGIPDSKAAVADILVSIYTGMFTAQDSEGRALTDSLSEVAEHDEVGGKKIRALSLEILKRRVDRGLYKRLDLLQRDVFLVLERARRLSRSDSQAWEDSVELSRRFIKARNQHCEGGLRLQSKALEYTMEMLEKSVAAAKDGEREEGEKEEGEDTLMEEGGTSAWSGLGTDGAQYHVGDFIYVKHRETEGGDPHIYMVERMFEKDGAKAIWGAQFFRQRETFHVPTRTFYEKEVMKGDIHEAIPISKVLGKCYVMPVKDYFRQKPQGFEETSMRRFLSAKYWENVTLCQSRTTSDKSPKVLRRRTSLSVSGNIQASSATGRRSSQLDSGIHQSTSGSCQEKRRWNLRGCPVFSRNVLRGTRKRSKSLRSLRKGWRRRYLATSNG